MWDMKDPRPLRGLPSTPGHVAITAFFSPIQVACSRMLTHIGGNVGIRAADPADLAAERSADTATCADAEETEDHQQVRYPAAKDPRQRTRLSQSRAYGPMSPPISSALRARRYRRTSLSEP